MTAVHPGRDRDGNLAGHATPVRAICSVLASPEKGAKPVIRLAADPGMGGASGKYFNRFREVEPSPQALSDGDAAAWELAEREVG